jgi:hypothetical protein
MRPSLASQLIPVECFEIGFSTSASVEHRCVVKTDLNDEALGVHKVASRFKHPVVRPPEATGAPSACDP